MKPKHISWYSQEHTERCHQTLVALMHGLGPWKQSIMLIGGLAPAYLIPEGDHAGTTDVDLLLHLDIFARTDAYSTLEKNLKRMGFERDVEENRPLHWRWKKKYSERATVIVELLCEDQTSKPGQSIKLFESSQLKALSFPGLNLAWDDAVEVEISADLPEVGVTIELVRVVGIGALVALKALAYGDRGEQKDAYDLVYCLDKIGPDEAAEHFKMLLSKTMAHEHCLAALKVLKKDFTTDQISEGFRKNGPVAYAAFLTDPSGGDSNANVRRQRTASALVEAFLKALNLPEALHSG